MLHFRDARANDIELYFKWVNDPVVRQNSLNTDKIIFQDHIIWFTRKIEDPSVFMYLFLNEENEPVGQVIIERKKDWVSVGQSVAQEHRGKKYSTEMLSKATDDFLNKFPKDTIVSVVKASNIASLKMSINSGFTIVTPDNEEENNLVLKGNLQNDESYIIQAKRFSNLF